MHVLISGTCESVTLMNVKTVLKVEIILGNRPRGDHPRLSSVVFYNYKGPYEKKIGKSMLEEGNV